MREELGAAAQKNSPVYRERHVKTVVPGTREALPRTTARRRKRRTYKPEKVKWRAAGRESEGAIVPKKRGQHNLVEGRAETNTPLCSWKSRRYERVNAKEWLTTRKEKVQELQRVLYLAAKENPKRRFHALYDKVHRKDVMEEAWKQVKANAGSPGVDKLTIEHIVTKYGEERFVEETIEMVRSGVYRAKPVRRQEIPKGDGKMRPLGIPTVRDRLVQMATKIVIEPIYEADFRECSYGFRPKRSAHGATEKIRETVNQGKIYWVVDVDITGYFDNIPHEKLMQLVGKRQTEPTC